jgi:predicted transcriptional regulator
MVNLKMLKEKIAESGITMVALSKKSGIERATLYNRLDGIGEFTASEISGVSDALRFNKKEREDIFFAKRVE